jgi:hypothetical protein
MFCWSLDSSKCIITCQVRRIGLRFLGGQDTRAKPKKKFNSVQRKKKQKQKLNYDDIIFSYGLATTINAYLLPATALFMRKKRNCGQ